MARFEVQEVILETAMALAFVAVVAGIGIALTKFEAKPKPEFSSTYLEPIYIAPTPEYQ